MIRALRGKVKNLKRGCKIKKGSDFYFRGQGRDISLEASRISKSEPNSGRGDEHSSSHLERSLKAEPTKCTVRQMVRVRERRIEDDAKSIGLRKQTNEMPTAELGKVWVMNE